MNANGNDDALTGARAMGVVIALLGSALLLLPPLLGTDSLREHLWAFDALRDVPLAVRLAGCALLWLSTWARVQQGLTRASGFAMEHGRAVATVLLCSGMTLGWCARQRNFELGDSAHLLNFLTFEVHTRGQLVTYDEPLELFFHSLTYRILHDAFDARVEHAYALLSILAGAVAWLAVGRFWHRVESRPAARVLALLLFAASASNQLFFGYVENYTLAAAAMLVYILLAERALAGAIHLTIPAFALGIAASLHILSGWLGLSLLWLWWVGPQRRAHTLAAIVLAGAAPILATVAGLTAIGVPLASLNQTHLAALKFIFLIEPGSQIYVYPAFSLAHWKDIANQWLLVSLPATLAAIAGVWIARRKLPWRDPLLGFLGFGSLGLHVFAATWNAEIGAYQDWDLFAAMGLVDSLLGARILLLASRSERTILAVGLPIAVFGLLLTGCFVWSNATREVIVIGQENVHAYSHATHAKALREAGQPDAAASELEDALRTSPHDPALLYQRGRIAWEANDGATARAFFERLLAVEPEGPRADQIRSALERLGRERVPTPPQQTGPGGE